MIEKMLEGAGLAVVTARDGLEAIEKAFADDVGLVILDVMMPRMNGYQACRLLKSEPATRALPVVILTSKDQPGDRFWGLRDRRRLLHHQGRGPAAHPGAGARTSWPASPRAAAAARGEAPTSSTS